MTGLVVFSVVLMALLQLQKMTPWLVWIMLGFIGLRYAFVGVSKMSKYQGLTDWAGFTDSIQVDSTTDNSMFTEDVFAALENLSEEEIFGQEHVIEPLIAKIRANADIPGRKRPFVSAAFFGPPGVGKTTLAEQLGNAIFKASKYYIRIDSSQYKDHDLSSLFGAGKSYQGSDTYGAITHWLKTDRKGVLLIDEPDRVMGDPKRWIQAMMPLLDGRVTEVSTKQEFSTRDTAILFASNYEHEKLGRVAEAYHQLRETMTPAELSASMRKEAMAILEGSVFPKAFLDRLDLILIFAPLNKQVMAEILLKEIYILAAKHGMEVEHVGLDVLQAAVKVAKAGESVGARDFNRWVDDVVNPALRHARNQGATKLKLGLGPDGKVYATITETQDEQPANPPRRGGRS